VEKEYFPSDAWAIPLKSSNAFSEKNFQEFDQNVHGATNNRIIEMLTHEFIMRIGINRKMSGIEWKVEFCSLLGDNSIQLSSRMEFHLQIGTYSLCIYSYDIGDREAKELHNYHF
jgi:hypothetical protein